ARARRRLEPRRGRRAGVRASRRGKPGRGHAPAARRPGGDGGRHARDRVDPPMRRGWLLALALVLLVPCLLYGAVAATMWRMQESLIFPAPGGIDVSALDQA